MNDQTQLARRYRRLLIWYPREFRHEHGEEILSVLMACAGEDQGRPGIRASLDLIRGGLWMHLRPRPPRAAPAVRAAIWLMYTGAGVTIVSLVAALVALPFLGRSGATLRVAGGEQPLSVAVAVGVVIAVAIAAIWLWMARANSKGRSWARVLSTALVGLETLQLLQDKGALEVTFGLVTWLIGLTAVWLLWLPSSGEFFDRPRTTGPREVEHPS